MIIAPRLQQQQPAIPQPSPAAALPPALSTQQALAVLPGEPPTFAAYPGGGEGAELGAAELHVTKDMRILVQGATIRPEVNGTYIARPAPAKKGERPGPPKFRFVSERSGKFILNWLLESRSGGGEKKCGYWFISRVLPAEDAGGPEKRIRLYEVPAKSMRSLPMYSWRVAGHSAALQSEATLQIFDVCTFSLLAANVGLPSALWTELRSMAYSEVSSDFTQEQKISKVYSMEDEDDDETFDVGNMVLFHESESFVKEVFAEKGYEWDPRIPGVLGQSLQVVEVPSKVEVVVKLSPELGEPDRLAVPALLLDRDFSNIWSFYTHQPFFITLQTLTCVVLWIYFAMRDAGRGGQPFTKTMGGLETVWPGKTSLLLTYECEDYRAEIWRWLSYQFSHVGLSHIGTNAAMNLLLGVPLEKFHGTLKMAVMYELGVFGGACCYLVADGHRPVVGTSGGCFALIGIRLGDLVMNWGERPYRYWRLVFLTVLIGFNIGSEMLNEPEGGVSTSNAAHLGGGLAGLLAGVVIGRNLDLEYWERALQVAAVLLGITLMGFCFGTGLQWPPQNMFEDEPWCWMRQVSNATIFGNWDWQCVRCHSQECMAEWLLQRRIYTVNEETCVGRGGFAVTEG